MKIFLYNLIFFTLPHILYANTGSDKTGRSLVNLPGLSGEEVSTIGEYITALFYIAVGIAALFAVIKLVIAGARYMTSDSASGNQSAKTDIRGALTGLLLLLAVVIILNTINENIMKTKIVTVPVRVEQTVGGGGGTYDQYLGGIPIFSNEYLREGDEVFYFDRPQGTISSVRDAIVSACENINEAECNCENINENQCESGINYSRLDRFKCYEGEVFVSEARSGNAIQWACVKRAGTASVPLPEGSSSETPSLDGLPNPGTPD